VYALYCINYCTQKTSKREYNVQEKKVENYNIARYNLNYRKLINCLKLSSEVVSTAFKCMHDSVLFVLNIPVFVFVLGV